MQDKKFERFLKIFPWYYGLSADLLFWVAVDTLFLHIAKGFAVTEIVKITMVADVAGIVIQIPILKIVEKLGNTKSVRLGSFLAVVSASMLTFGKGFAVIAIGRVLRDVSYSFKYIVSISLEHNLSLQNRESEFVKYSTKGNTIYAATTMLIALVANAMFNLNHYFPMVCCIAACVICFVLSFYMSDFTEGAAVKEVEKPKKDKTKFSFLIILAFVSFGVFFSIVTTGQENAKLFIQSEMLLDFSVKNAALILGAVVFIARVARVVGNVLFYKVYRIIKDKAGIIFSVFLLSAFIFLIAGYFVNILAIKYVLMALGYIIILFTRDPFKVYINGLVLTHSTIEQHQKIIMILEYARKIMTAVISASFAAILQVKPLIFIVVIYAIYALLEIAVSLWLYLTIRRSKV